MLRKIYFIFIVLVLMISACSKKEKGFTINGNVEGLADSTMLYLIDPTIETRIDSSMVLNNKFHFKGKLDCTKRLIIKNNFTSFDDYVTTSFWAENTDITITGTKEDFRFVDVKGSKAQEASNILKNQTKELIKESLKLRDSVDIAYQKYGRNSEPFNKVYRTFNDIHQDIKNIELAFIKEYTNSYEALSLLQYRKEEFAKDTLQQMYDKLAPEYKNSIYAEPIAIYLNTKLVDEGDNYADFEAQTANGETVKLSDFVKDKYVLLDFWGTGCGPCQSFNKHMAKNFEDVSKYLEVVSYSMDGNAETTKSTIKEDNMTWNVISNFKGFNGEAPITYQIHGIPTFFLISPEGKIVKKQVGFSPESFDEILKIAKG